MGSVRAHGVSGDSTSIALHQSWSVSVIWLYAHWSSGWCLILPAHRSACIPGDQFVSLTGLCVSQPKHSLRVVFIGHLKSGLTWCPPPRTSGTLSTALTYSHASLVLMHPVIDLSVAVALSSSLMVAMTPCHCGALGGLYIRVGSLTYPSPGRMFGPSCIGRLTWRVTWLTYRPPPRTSRTLSIALTDGRDI